MVYNDTLYYFVFFNPHFPFTLNFPLDICNVGDLICLDIFVNCPLSTLIPCHLIEIYNSVTFAFIKYFGNIIDI